MFAEGVGGHVFLHVRVEHAEKHETVVVRQDDADWNVEAAEEPLGLPREPKVPQHRHETDNGSEEVEHGRLHVYTGQSDQCHYGE